MQEKELSNNTISVRIPDEDCGDIYFEITSTYGNAADQIPAVLDAIQKLRTMTKEVDADHKQKFYFFPR